MTVVFKKPVSGPATHALVIGVGAYDYLSGGDKSLLEGFEDLGQLESPGPSADYLASWLIEHHNNPSAELATVELLKSPAGPTSLVGNKILADVEAATCDNVCAAVERWFKECDRHEGNVALFYFAGHGIWRETATVLTADFGHRSLNPFLHALDIGKLHSGMASCKARVQCFFVDACRQFSRATSRWLMVNASAPLPTSISALQRPRDAPIIYAAAPGEFAYGLPGGLTLFVQALVATLDGLGARRFSPGTQWIVPTSRLVDGANSWFRYVALREGAPKQRCHSGGDSAESTVHVIDGEPQVLVTLSVVPRASARDSVLSLWRDGARSYAGACNPSSSWCEYVRGGPYDLRVESVGGNFATQEQLLRALPPPEIFEEVEVR